MAHEVGSGTRAWADNQRSASASVYGWGKMSLRLRHTLRLSANRISAGLSASTQSRTTQDWHSNLKSVAIPFGRLTFALWRAEEGAQRRYASVAHQRAVRRQRHARLSDLACGRVHTRTKRKVRQKHSRAVAPIPKDRAFREGPRLKTSRATQTRPWSLSQVARG